MAQWLTYADLLLSFNERVYVESEAFRNSGVIHLSVSCCLSPELSKHRTTPRATEMIPIAI